MEINNKQFIIGFNSGYLLAKHEPDLLELIFNGVTNNLSYIIGVKQGKREHDLEIFNKRLIDLDSINKQNNYFKDKDI